MSNEMYVEGYAIVFNQKTMLYEHDGIKYYEIIDSRALDNADMSDVSLKYNHSNEVMIAAATRNGSLNLIKDSNGLRIVARLANTTVGRDLYEMIKSDLITKMSFAFTAGEDIYNSYTKTRTITKIKKLYDCSAVDVPAYPTTSIRVMTSAEVAAYNERRRLLLQMDISDSIYRDSILRNGGLK